MEDSKPAPTQFAAGDTSDANGLKSRIVACLRDRIPNSQRVHVTAFGGTCVLRGTLSSAHEKRLCLECCRHVPGVIRVIDELVVTDENPVHFDADETDLS
jgi:osmotically-inducible protein OsmY